MSRTRLLRAFNVGDRVELIDPGAAFACRNGQVVFRHGFHDPAWPRVRWATGWGVSHGAHRLRLQTPEEQARPAPQLFPCDILVGGSIRPALAFFASLGGVLLGLAFMIAVCCVDSGPTPPTMRGMVLALTDMFCRGFTYVVLGSAAICVLLALIALVYSRWWHWQAHRKDRKLWGGRQ